jgi:penicillin-binding protein 1A
MMLLRIDKKTGKIASSGSKDAVNIWFKKGTQPDDVAPEKGAVGVQDFIMGAP